MARLGHPVRLDDRDAVGLLAAGEQRGAQRRRARADETQRLRRRPVLLVEDHPVQRRPGRHPGHGVIPRVAPEAPRREACGHDHGAAAREGREHRGDEAVHVEERHRAERDVVAAQGVELGEAAGRRDQVPLQEGNLFRPARRPARVENERDVVGLGALVRHDGQIHELVDCEELRPALCSVADRRAGAVPGEDEHRCEVVQVEGVLLGGVARVQRSGGGAGCGHRQEKAHELRPVGDDERDAVAPAGARRP